MVDSTFNNGAQIAYFHTDTNGPEARWDIELRLCVEDEVPHLVVYDPFANRLMYFNNDANGLFSARRAFCSLVELAMFDSDVRKF